MHFDANQPSDEINDGNVKWKFEEIHRTTLWEAKIHGKETFSLAYNFRLSIEETECELTGRSISYLSGRLEAEQRKKK